MENLRRRLGTLIPECGDTPVLDYLAPILLRNRAVLSGGMILQSLLGERWGKSDVDLYVTEDNFFELLSDLEDLKQEFKVIMSSNYHNSFMSKNNVTFLASATIPVVEEVEDNGDDNNAHIIETPETGESTYYYVPESPFTFELGPSLKRIFRDKVYFDCSIKEKQQVEGFSLPFQIIVIKKGVTLESVIGSFDLTFCQVFFDGQNFGVCGETTMEDVLAKRGRLADDYYKLYNHTLNIRIEKYKKRGFHIDIDWLKVGQMSGTLYENMSRDEHEISIIKKEIVFHGLYFCYCYSSSVRRIDSIYDLLKQFNLQMLSFNVYNKMPIYLHYRKYADRLIEDFRFLPKYVSAFYELFDTNPKAVINYAQRILENERGLNTPRIRWLTENETEYNAWRSSTVDGTNPFLRKIVNDMRSRGTLRPSKTCLLVGASAIASLLEKKMKPTYLLPCDFMHFGKVLSGTYIRYHFEKFEDCNVLFYSTYIVNLDAILTFWPVFCAYYDGEHHYYDERLTSRVFHLRFNNIKNLKKSSFIANEFKQMLELGFKYDTENYGLERGFLYRLVMHIYGGDSYKEFDIGFDLEHEEEFDGCKFLLEYDGTIQDFIDNNVPLENIDDYKDKLIKRGYNLESSLAKTSNAEMTRFYRYYLSVLECILDPEVTSLDQILDCKYGF
jgi:hypothetical protein